MGRFYLLAAVIILIALIIVVSFFVSSFKKCPPGHVLIINNNKPDNFGNMNKIIFSGGAFVWPFVGSFQLFSLAPIAVTLNEELLSKNNERLKINIKTNIGISTSEMVLKNAIDRFSGLGISQIKQIALDVMLSKLREVVAGSDKNDLEKIQDFSNRLKKEIEGELMEIGLKLINLDVKSID
jgi:uncharacterized membrane protein YqiK